MNINARSRNIVAQRLHGTTHIQILRLEAFSGDNCNVLLLLSLQPVLTAVVCILAAIFNAVPICKRYGMVVVLTEVDQDGLDLLSRAGLSGELKRVLQ
jgi:hypothetical protein